MLCVNDVIRDLDAIARVDVDGSTARNGRHG